MFNSHGQVVLSQKELKIILCHFNRVIKYLVCLNGDPVFLLRSRVVSLTTGTLSTNFWHNSKHLDNISNATPKEK